MRHKHDCEQCRPLGEFMEFDLYFCEQQIGGPTVIARFGPNGNYNSGMCFADTMPELGEAKRRAIQAGLIPVPASATSPN